jgi:predicted nucleotidyltransferase
VLGGDTAATGNSIILVLPSWKLPNCGKILPESGKFYEGRFYQLSVKYYQIEVIMGFLRFLFTERQQRLLSAILLRPEREWTLSDLLERGGSGHGSTQQFVKNLLEAGVVEQIIDRKRRRFKANTRHPIYAELASICRKTFGIRDVVAEALTPFYDRITEAFIFGSVAKGTEGPDSDIDVLVVGNVRPSHLLSLKKSLEEGLCREIHFNVYDQEEWESLRTDDPIVKAIANGPRLQLSTRSVSKFGNNTGPGGDEAHGAGGEPVPQNG